MAGPDFAAIEVARKHLRDKEAALAASVAAADLAQSRLVAAQRRDRSAAELADLVAAANAAEQVRTKRLAEVAASRGELNTILEPVRLSPDEQIANQARAVPMALLPVRIETRLHDGDVLIRIYPDQIHLHRHADEISKTEALAGQTYWQAAAGNGDVPAAWEALVSAVGSAGRARFVAMRTRTSGGGAPPDGATTEAIAAPRPEARVLPTAWCATLLSADDTVLLRKWSAPVAERLAMAPAGDWVDTVETSVTGDLPIDSAAQWLVDFDEAVACGMALRIKPADFGPHGVPDHVDRLVVVGSNWTLSPATAAAALRDQLLAHSYGQGFALPANGTPTNRSSDAPMLPDRPLPAPSNSPAVESDLTALARALGLPAGWEELAGSPGTDRAFGSTVRSVQTALWGSCFGFFLGPVLDPILSSDALGETRVHVRDYLRPAGPLPTIQVGRQPYGVLPVLATPVRKGRLDALGGYPGQLARILANIRALAEGYSLDPGAPGQLKVKDVLAELPNLHASQGAPLAERLAQILKQGPLARGARVRPTLGPAEREAMSADPNSLAVRHAALVDLLLLYTAGFLNSSWPAALIYELAVPLQPRFRLDAIPWVASDLGTSDDVAQALAHLRARIAEATADPAAMSKLLSVAADDAKTLFEGLLLLSAAYEFWEAGAAFVRDDIAVVPDQPFAATPAAATARLASASVVGIDMAAPRAGQVAVETAAELLALSGARTLDTSLLTHLQTLLAAADPHPAVRDLQAYHAALDTLSTRPAVEIDQALRGYLDAGSHRLDAWITSLATRRLATYRDSQAEGIHLGCYGIVHDLTLASGQPASEGYVHVPSADHAVTAALLRSGHLANLDDDDNAFAIRLTSHRVRDALAIVDGMIAGQPVGALLGYRFERWLVDDRLAAKYIGPLRRLKPLPLDADPSASTDGSPAPRDVVDGLALAEAWAADRAGLLAALRQLVGAPLDPAPDRFLDALTDLHDAFLDLWVTEATHQLGQGNAARTAAAIATLDRQERPPEPRAVHTPRNAWSYAQRVVWAAPHDLAAHGWPQDLIGECEPVANAMAARLIGDPVHFQLSAVVVDAAGSPIAGESRRTAKLGDLAMSPLALARLAAPADGDGPTALEWRIVQAMIADAPLPAAAGLQFDDSSDGEGLQRLLATMRMTRKVLFDRPALTARALASPAGPVADGIDDGALNPRTKALKNWIDQQSAALESALQGGNPTVIAAAVRAAAVLAPVPQWAALAPLAAGELESLARSLLATLSGWQQSWAVPPGDPGASPVEQDSSRIRMVLGQDFPVLPPFSLPAALRDELRASLADQDALMGPLGTREIRRWRRAMALVRPKLRDLNIAFDAARGLDKAERQWRIAQSPHQAGRRWASLPLDDHEPPRDVQLSLMLAGDIPQQGAMAGILVDDWPEAVPERAAATSLTFHFDAPAARPPQAIVLAVDAGLGETTWSVDALVDTVNETFDLARLRLLTPSRIPGHGALLPTAFLPRNLSDQMPSFDLLGLAAGSLVSTILGKPGS